MGNDVRIILQLSPYTDQIGDDGTEFTKRPYPFGVALDGTILGMRDEVRAIGFQLDAANQRVDLYWEEYVTKPPEVAVGKYLVTQDAKGQYATNVCAVASVRVQR